MTEAVPATIVEKWNTGFDSKSGYVVLLFEFEGRPPLPFVIPLSEAVKLGRALINIDSEGISSPARPN